MKQAITQTLQIIAGYLSALFSALGQRKVSASKGGVTAASRSNAGPSMDWQAWGTQSGLCWRATRDGLRHVPAGPPKSHRVEPSPVIALRGTRRIAGPRRFPARRATIFLRHVSQSSSITRAREIALVTRNSVFDCGPSAGAGKNAPSPRADSSREESWGCSCSCCCSCCCCCCCCCSCSCSWGWSWGN
jgi:hypothetical protein